MRKINVLFMQSQDYFGADSMIHTLLMRYLDRSMFTVHVASNHGSEGDRPAPYKVLTSIPDISLRHTQFGPSVTSRNRAQVLREAIAGSGATLGSLTGLVNYARRERIDIVHCTEKPRDVLIGLLVAKAVGARCVIHLHVKVENWIRSQVRWAMKHADALVGVSDFVAGSIVALGYPATKTYSVLNALDLSRWNNQDDGKLDADPWSDGNDGSAIRREFGLAPNVPLLAVVSRLTPWKGHTELLKALALVKQQVPDFRLLLVGEDDARATPGGGSYSAELKQLSIDLGLTEHIIFTGFRRDVPQLMAASDIYTMPSFEEPFGMVYLEAMALRKPVVALDNGGAREIIEHGKSGLLSLPKDIEHLAENIVTLIKQPELRAQMGQYGRRQVEERFTPVRMARDMQHIYQQLVGANAGELARA